MNEAISIHLKPSNQSVNSIANMKDNVTPLYTSPQLGAKVSTYSEQHSTPLPKYISDYHAHIVSTRDDSEYLSSGFQSQFNIFLAKSIGAKRGKLPSSDTSPSFC